MAALLSKGGVLEAGSEQGTMRMVAPQDSSVGAPPDGLYRWSISQFSPEIFYFGAAFFQTIEPGVDSSLDGAPPRLGCSRPAVVLCNNTQRPPLLLALPKWCASEPSRIADQAGAPLGYETQGKGIIGLSCPFDRFSSRQRQSA